MIWNFLIIWFLGSLILAVLIGTFIYHGNYSNKKNGSDEAEDRHSDEAPDQRMS